LAIGSSSIGPTTIGNTGTISLKGTTTVESIADTTTTNHATNAAGGGGYKGLPQNAGVLGTSYTLVAGDAGKHIYSQQSRPSITIPDNATVPFPIGTTVTFINGNNAQTPIQITTDTLYLAGQTGITGTRNLDRNGIATVIKTTATSWIISGVGLT
jgi:hypothetical protein